jgi:hypothetical protein
MTVTNYDVPGIIACPTSATADIVTVSEEAWNLTSLSIPVIESVSLIESIALFSDADGEDLGEDNAALLQALVELSTSGDGLDWDTLARIDIEGWGS